MAAKTHASKGTTNVKPDTPQVLLRRKNQALDKILENGIYLPDSELVQSLRQELIQLSNKTLDKLVIVCECKKY